MIKRFNCGNSLSTVGRSVLQRSKTSLCNFLPKVESGSCSRFAEKFSVLTACVSRISPFTNTDLIARIWSDVLPYCNEPCPDASVLIIPPSVARLLVESSGEKNKPCGLRYWLSWSFTTPACTRTQRSFTFSSKIWVI